ncbi:hypothetical protein KY285_026101 [Solanum tuberosum]|nr:hypothetical protein KY285_026101 [Solanum tuberosum]
MVRFGGNKFMSSLWPRVRGNTQTRCPMITFPSFTSFPNKSDLDDVGQSTPFIVVPVKVTRSVKRSLEEGFALMHSKKQRCSTGKTPCTVTPIDVLDDSSEFERPR